MQSEVDGRVGQLAGKIQLLKKEIPGKEPGVVIWDCSAALQSLSGAFERFTAQVAMAQLVAARFGDNKDGVIKMIRLTGGRPGKKEDAVFVIVPIDGQLYPVGLVIDKETEIAFDQAHQLVLEQLKKIEEENKEA